jgi:hypothetical protein
MLLGLPSLARADAAPENNGCDCNLSQKSDRASAKASGKRRLGIATFAVLAAGAFWFSARRVRSKGSKQ